MIKDAEYSPLYDIKNQTRKIAIVKSTYYLDLSNTLEEETRENLVAFGFREENITTFKVFGSWEIPLVVKKATLTKLYDGIVALGIIVKGETNHFEILCDQCPKALMDISLEFNIPLAFGLLTVYNQEQARERIFTTSSKGMEAAKSLAQTFKTLSSL